MAAIHGGNTAPYVDQFLLRKHEPSVVTSWQLSQIRATYDIPDNFLLRLPRADETPSSFCESSLCFFIDQFKYGLRLPLSEAVVALMLESGFIPAMLSPNAFPQFLAAHSFFAREGIPWDVTSFFYCFGVQSKDGHVTFKSRPGGKISMTGLPTSNPQWKSRYIFIDNADGWLVPTEPTTKYASVFKPSPSSLSPSLTSFLLNVEALSIDVRDHLPRFATYTGGDVAYVPRQKARASRPSGGGEGSSMSGSVAARRGKEPATTSRKAPRTSTSRGPSASVLDETIFVHSSEEERADRRFEEQAEGMALDADDSDVHVANVEEPEDEEDPPLVWSTDGSTAMLRKFHGVSTSVTGGEAPDFALQLGDLVRSRFDTPNRNDWPRHEVARRAMMDGLRSFNSMFYLTRQIEFYKVESAQYSSELDRTIIELTKERDERRAEKATYDAASAQFVQDKRVLMDRVTDSELAKFGAQKELTDLKASQSNLEKAAEERAVRLTNDAMEASRRDLLASRDRCAQLEATIRDQAAGREAEEAKVAKLEAEVTELRRRMVDPTELCKLYAPTELHEEEMVYVGRQGFYAAIDHICDVVLSRDDPAQKPLVDDIAALNYEDVLYESDVSESGTM